VCHAEQFTSFRFWQSDPLGERDLGVPLTKVRVLVSGGGDGGLQDFIRIATGLKSAKEVYLSLPPQVRKWESRIQDIEDQAQRCYVWSLPRHDHKISQFVHNSHAAIVAEIVQEQRSEMLEWQRNVVEPRMEHISALKLAFTCSHFKQCYGLNRFLTLLIAHVLKEFAKKDVLLPNVMVRSVRSRVHTCNGSPKECYGKEHEVEFETFGCAPRDSPVNSSQMFDIIVLRHGLGNPGIKYMGADPLFMRQLLPYYWSW
jgi:hypothetical protein